VILVCLCWSHLLVPEDGEQRVQHQEKHFCSKED
jgi:hypothetical protein